MKVWGLAATLGFVVLAFGLSIAVGSGVLTATGYDPVRIGNDGTAVAISVLAANPVQIITLVLAARLTGEDVFAYFALDVPRWREVSIAVAGLGVVIVVVDLLTVVFGRDLVPPFQLEIHRSAVADGTLVWLWLALIVGAGRRGAAVSLLPVPRRRARAARRAAGHPGDRAAVVVAARSI